MLLLEYLFIAAVVVLFVWFIRYRRRLVRAREEMQEPNTGIKAFTVGQSESMGKFDGWKFGRSRFTGFSFGDEKGE